MLIFLVKTTFLAITRKHIHTAKVKQISLSTSLLAILTNLSHEHFTFSSVQTTLTR